MDRVSPRRRRVASGGGIANIATIVSARGGSDRCPCPTHRDLHLATSYSLLIVSVSVSHSSHDPMTRNLPQLCSTTVYNCGHTRWAITAPINNSKSTAQAIYCRQWQGAQVHRTEHKPARPQKPPSADDGTINSIDISWANGLK